MRNILNESGWLKVAERLDDESQESLYAGHTVALVHESGQDFKPEWSIVLDDNGYGTMEITALGYLQAGYPQVLDVYEDTSGKPVFSMDFVYNTPETEVIHYANIPTFDDIVGNHPEATRTIVSVFISDSLREEMNAPDEPSSGPKAPMTFTAEDLGLEGCDLKEIILGFEEQIGQVENEEITITKTGENQGQLMLSNGELNLTYDPTTGKLDLSMYKGFDGDEEIKLFWGDLLARYGPDMKGVELKGFLFTSLIFDPADFLM